MIITAIGAIKTGMTKNLRFFMFLNKPHDNTSSINYINYYIKPQLAASAIPLFTKHPLSTDIFKSMSM